MQLNTKEYLHPNIRSHFPAGISENYAIPHSSSIERHFDKTPDEEFVLKRSGYHIRLVDTPRQRARAGMLIERMYSWRGYHTDTAAAAMLNNINQLTLEASSEHQIFGTLTLGMDSERGLLADELYEQEINSFRGGGRKVCELSKLAIDSEYSSKEMLASLFHLAYIFGRNIHKATDLFIEVNPRHAGFYKRMLGLRQIGEERTCRRVQAPAVLMHLELDYVDAQIASLAGSCKSGEKSLYPYFFSRHEEIGLARKLQWYNN
ncbi:long-chain N-acyl amino acid synthase [Nitrosospira sp. NpAV]|uniref:N-acyl amino acid synthase FeeM domain-containing protein n=1 Tax=Nitrosospira sp. NpAV TaxID=58133 RepID=UPI0018DB2498|nr:long-chain N-acyl amino acid synthase [Nitrosospira sp. NpAV]